MIDEIKKNIVYHRTRGGVVLLATLVLLVILAMVGYTMGSRVRAYRHRSRYIMDYQTTRYACDSALKYAIAIIEKTEPQLLSRPNEPDFSDLFSLDETEYEEFLEQWASEDIIYYDQDVNGIEQINDINLPVEANDINAVVDVNEPNTLTVRGPYGWQWPLVAEAVELQIGSATVTIEIEDENAKYPIGWAMLEGKKVKRESAAGFETFCEWMDINEAEIDFLLSQLDQLSEIKRFKIDFKPVVKRTVVKGRSRRRRGRRPPPRRTVTTTVAPASVHRTDFAHLFHSTAIETDILARPTVISDDRQESALKYAGMWASRKVNINTAPRHVLEAAFTFGGDEVEIADEIISRRRIKPFKDIEQLRKELFRYSDSIEKSQKYITTKSNFFTIRVTAVSGSAKTSTVAAVVKERTPRQDEADEPETVKVAVISS